MTAFRWAQQAAVAIVCSFSVVHASSPATSPARFKVSDGGDEVIDIQAKLVWKRCVEGMNWDGLTCSGKAQLFDYTQAQARAKVVFQSTRLPWRLPHVPELKRLIESGHSNPKVDQVLFPHSPPQWFWSASASVASNGTFNPYNYGNISQGRTSSSSNQMAFLHGWAVNLSNGEARGEVAKHSALAVRLVRGAP